MTYLLTYNSVYCCVWCLQGELDGDSLPVDLLLEEVKRGTALTPDETFYRSVSDVLVEQQLAVSRWPLSLSHLCQFM